MPLLALAKADRAEGAKSAKRSGRQSPGVGLGVDLEHLLPAHSCFGLTCHMLQDPYTTEHIFGGTLVQYVFSLSTIVKETLRHAIL